MSHQFLWKVLSGTRLEKQRYGPCHVELLVHLVLRSIVARCGPGFIIADTAFSEGKKGVLANKKYIFSEKACEVGEGNFFGEKIAFYILTQVELNHQNEPGEKHILL